MPADAIIITPEDNVATALRPLAKGERILVKSGSIEIEVSLLQDIPFGHKFALKNIPLKQPVIKYGETIGLASAPIPAGGHVHIHNVEGTVGRGDKT